MELNPGHLDSLRRLGILGEHETAISAAEMAARIAQSPNIEPALSDIRQEAQNIAMGFDLIIQTIDDIEAILPDLTTRAAIEPELQGLAEEVFQLTLIPKRAGMIRVFSEALIQIAGKRAIRLTNEAIFQLEKIFEALDQVPQEVSENVGMMIRRGEQIIAELISRLENLP